MQGGSQLYFWRWWCESWKHRFTISKWTSAYYKQYVIISRTAQITHKKHFSGEWGYKCTGSVSHNFVYVLLSATDDDISLAMIVMHIAVWFYCDSDDVTNNSELITSQSGRDKSEPHTQTGWAKSKITKFGVFHSCPLNHDTYSFLAKHQKWTDLDTCLNYYSLWHAWPCASQISRYVIKAACSEQFGVQNILIHTVITCRGIAY